MNTKQITAIAILMLIVPFVAAQRRCENLINHTSDIGVDNVGDMAIDAVGCGLVGGEGTNYTQQLGVLIVVILFVAVMVFIIKQARRL